jgi:site-specific DNA-cytosine methylase
MTAPTARPAAPPTCGSLFSGGRGADVGLRAAGFVSAWTVERDPAIDAVGAANVPAGRSYVADVGDVDPRRLEPVDLLWASPPCQGASVARSPHLPRHADADAGDLLVPYLSALGPRAFVLENVPRYRREPSFARIVAALHDLGYMTHATIVNCADFGVPQTRRRLILRAVRGGLVPHLPPPVPWTGWYRAIEDLIPSLPESAFAPWQLARLPALIDDSTLFVAQESTDHKGGSYGTPGRAAGKPAHCLTGRSPGWYKAFLLMTANCQLAHPTGTGVLPPDTPANTVAAGRATPRAFLVSNAATEYGDGIAPAEDPAWSVTAQTAGRARAFIVSGQSVNGGPPSIREAGEPCATVGTNADRSRAFIVGGQYQTPNGTGRVPQHRPADAPIWTVTANEHGDTRAWLAQGRVVAMTPRALARFMAFPDTYTLPERRSLAGTVLGNAVPPLLAQRIGEGLLACL